MKAKTCLTAWLLSFCISFGCVAALATTFDLQWVNLWELGYLCFILCGVCAWCFFWKPGFWIALALAAAFAGHLWYRDDLWDSLRALAYHLSVRFDSAYGWGTLSVPSWIKHTINFQTALKALMLLPALTVCRTVCRPHRLLLSLPIALIPLYPCFGLTNLVPDGWCLFLILFGVLVLVLTQSLRRLSLKTGNRITAIVLIPAMLASWLLVYKLPVEELRSLVPQITLGDSPNIPGISPGDTFVPSVGAPDIDLSQIGPIPDLQNTVMSLTADFDGTVYLRQQVYDHYENNTWSVTDPGEHDYLWPTQNGAYRGQLTISTPTPLSSLVVPYYPQDPSVFSMVENGVIPNTNKIDQYTCRVGHLPDKLPATSLPIDHGTIWRQLPYETRMAALIYIGEHGLNTMTLEQIVDYVRNCADYDRQTEAMSSKQDFAMWFLNEAETGYCVHFATTAVVLLRAAGYHARYVTGYVAEVSAGRTTKVRGNQAHAWVEVLFDSYETQDIWVVVDPTPPEALTQEPEPTEPPTQPSTVPGTEPPTESVPDIQESTPPVLESTNPTEATEPNPVEKAQDHRVLLRLLLWLLGLAATVLALWLQRLIRMRIRLKRQRTGHPNTQALARWREICRLSRLLKTEPPEPLLELAEKARFSQHTLTREELHSLGQYLQLQHRALDTLPVWKRFFLRLIWAV